MKLTKIDGEELSVDSFGVNMKAGIIAAARAARDHQAVTVLFIEGVPTAAVVPLSRVPDIEYAGGWQEGKT